MTHFSKQKARFYYEVSKGKDQTDRLIPLINIVFLLLAFFMLTGVFKTANELKISPPNMEAKGLIDRKNIILQINASGDLAIQSKEVTLSQAIEIIKKEFSDKDNAKLYVKADKDLKANNLLDILRKLSEEKIQTIQLIVIRKGE